MPLQELIRPHTQQLTTLARVKSDMRITVTKYDTVLTDLIADASSTLIKEIGYPLFRAKVRESLVGEGHSELMLSRTPVAYVESVAVDGEVVPSDQFTVEPDIGLAIHETAWPNTKHIGAWITPFELPDAGRFKVAVEYWGGALGPDDNVVASGMAVDGVGKEFVFTDPPLVVPGDVIEAIGFGEPDNNGQFTVVSRSETGITVSADLVTEAAAPGAAQLLVRNLSRALERLCIDTVRAWFKGLDRDPNITSERIGDWSATYASGEQAHELPPNVFKSLDRWRRIV